MADSESILQLGIEAARAGDKAEARDLFRLVTREDPDNIQGWLWLAGVAEDREEKRAALERAVHIDPNNDLARKGLSALGGPRTPTPPMTPPPARVESPPPPRVESPPPARVESPAQTTNLTTQLPSTSPASGGVGTGAAAGMGAMGGMAAADAADDLGQFDLNLNADEFSFEPFEQPDDLPMTTPAAATTASPPSRPATPAPRNEPAITESDPDYDFANSLDSLDVYERVEAKAKTYNAEGEPAGWSPPDFGEEEEDDFDVSDYQNRPRVTVEQVEAMEREEAARVMVENEGRRRRLPVWLLPIAGLLILGLLGAILWSRRTPTPLSPVVIAPTPTRNVNTLPAGATASPARTVDVLVPVPATETQGIGIGETPLPVGGGTIMPVPTPDGSFEPVLPETATAGNVGGATAQPTVGEVPTVQPTIDNPIGGVPTVQPTVDNPIGGVPTAEPTLPTVLTPVNVVPTTPVETAVVPVDTTPVPDSPTSIIVIVPATPEPVVPPVTDQTPVAPGGEPTPVPPIGGEPTPVPPAETPVVAPTAAPAPGSVEAANPAIVPAEQRIVANTWNYQWNYGFGALQAPGNGNYGGVTPSRGEWLSLTIAVGNTGGQGVVIPDGFFVLKDDQNRVYDFNRAASVDWFNRFGGAGVAADQSVSDPVPPNESISMVLVFDVPREAQNLVLLSRENTTQGFKVR